MTFSLSKRRPTLKHIFAISIHFQSLQSRQIYIYLQHNKLYCHWWHLKENFIFSQITEKHFKLFGPVCPNHCTINIDVELDNTLYSELHSSPKLRQPLCISSLNWGGVTLLNNSIYMQITKNKILNKAILQPHLKKNNIL